MPKPILDINDLLPDKVKDSPGARSVNLMSFLLRGITYNRLYARPFYHRGMAGEDGKYEECALETLIRNTKMLPRKFDIPQKGVKPGFSVKELLYSFFHKRAFELIRDRFSAPGAPSLVLGDLFWKTKDAAEPLKRLTSEEAELAAFFVSTLNKVRIDQKGDMDHFCVPVIPFQLGIIPPLNPSCLTVFLSSLGHYELSELYTRASSDSAEKAAVRLAREHHILREYRETTHAKVTGGNGRICVNGSCCDSRNEHDWCNMVTVNGQPMCALGSDHGVPEDCVTKTTKKPAKKTATKKAAASKRKTSAKK